MVELEPFPLGGAVEQIKRRERVGKVGFELNHSFVRHFTVRRVVNSAHELTTHSRERNGDLTDRIVGAEEISVVRRDSQSGSRDG